MYRLIALALCFFLLEYSIAQTKPRLGFKKRVGYIITLDGDTIEAIVKKANPCDMAIKVIISVDDGTGNLVDQEFNPSRIKGFGYENNHFVSAGYNSAQDKLYIPSHPLNNYPRVFVKVYYNEGYILISQSEYYRRSLYHPLGQDNLSGCSEFGYRKGKDNIFHLVKNVKEEIEFLAKNDPVVMELITSRKSLSLEEAAEYLYRLDQHKKGIYLEDELSLYQKHMEKIQKIVSQTHVADLLFSELKTLDTPSGVILCRRTKQEDTKILMKFGPQAMANFKIVERNLSKGMQLYLADSLDDSFEVYIAQIKNAIGYIQNKLPDLDANYYRNELQFYELQLAAKKEH